MGKQRQTVPLDHLKPNHSTTRPPKPFKTTHTLVPSTGAAFKGQECSQGGLLVCGQRLWHAKRAKFKGIKIFCG